MHFRYFVIYPWKRTWFFVWSKLNPFKYECFVFQVWLKLDLWFWRRVLNFECIFTILLILLSPLVKLAFIWINFNPLHPRMRCAKYNWNWLSGSGEEDENVTSLRRQTTDKFRTEKFSSAFGSGELRTTLSAQLQGWRWANNSILDRVLKL